MIRIEDLEEAIASCQGEKNPNANTCIKLAAFYTIKNEMLGNSEQLPDFSGYSQQAQAENSQQIVDYDSDSEFAETVRGRNADEIWAIMDELMVTISVTNPRLYNAVMRKLKE